MTELYDQCRRKLLESAHSTVKSELLQHTRDFSFTKTCKTWKITVIGILCFTVIAKIFSLLHPTALLLEPDPVFGIPIKYMVFAASVTEILLVVFLWCARDLSNSAWAVIWFSLAIIGYRILAHSSGHSYCPCLGDVADWWPWLGQHENQVLMTTAIWLLLTSLAVLLSLRVEPVYLEGLKRTIAAAHLESPMIGMALAVLGLLVVLVTCVPLYIPFNGGADEGIELSKMLLLYRRPDLALLASGSQPWLYSHIFASVFSVTGFEPWIPRAVNIAFLGVLLLTLSRFMPAGAERWHWVGGCIFFLTWPSVFYLSVSARPDLAALALAVLAVAVLPQSRKEWRMWRFALSGLLLALAAQLRVASLMVITAGAISLILVNKKETRDEAGDAEISSLFRQQFWLGLFFASIFFVISFALFSAWHPSTDWRSLFSSFRMTALAPQAASYRFASRDLLRSPATMAAVLVGISLLSHRRLLGNAASVLTFLATVVVVSIGVRPWWYYDMVYFSIPMAILA
ncbi:MAG TPA: hypothetical protein VFM25_07660, partial [Verrucomicrobiae bacterium]|nr:hypothetical protein [Verrucomicrobiae bacterium]